MLSLETVQTNFKGGRVVEDLVIQGPELFEPGIALTAFHPGASSSLTDRESVSPVIAVVHPGHLSSRKHPDTAVVAKTLTEMLDITTVTLDPRGTHDSHTGQPSVYSFSQPVSDLYSLVHHLSPPKGVILGGHSLGGAQAMAAAARLVLESSEDTPRVVGVFTDKTMAYGEDFALLPAMARRAAKGLSFPQQSPITGRPMFEGPRTMHDLKNLEDYRRIGSLANHLAELSSTPVLLAASPEDTHINYGNVAKLAEQFPNAQFREVPGDHSDIRPEIAYSTGAIVAEWIAASGLLRNMNDKPAYRN